MIQTPSASKLYESGAQTQKPSPSIIKNLLQKDISSQSQNPLSQICLTPSIQGNQPQVIATEEEALKIDKSPSNVFTRKTPKVGGGGVCKVSVSQKKVLSSNPSLTDRDIVSSYKFLIVNNASKSRQQQDQAPVSQSDQKLFEDKFKLLKRLKLPAICANQLMKK